MHACMHMHTYIHTSNPPFSVFLSIHGGARGGVDRSDKATPVNVEIDLPSTPSGQVAAARLTHRPTLLFTESGPGHCRMAAPSSYTLRGAESEMRAPGVCYFVLLVPTPKVYRVPRVFPRGHRTQLFAPTSVASYAGPSS